MVPGPFEMSASASLSSPNQAKDVEARARFETGVRIARDTNSPQNMKVAAQYYELAAQQGLAAAQFRLAALFEKGLGVPRDMVRAKALYLAAAAQGHSKAMHNLGVLAAEGADGRPDYAGAAIWFEKAAQTGVRDSQFNFAVLLARGLGVARDLPRAYSLFALLANEGDAEAAKRRDDLAPRLTNAELAAAKATAAAFRPEPSDEAADERIATPARAPADSKPDVSGL
jgi:localization factor PodJL